ncbi:hypothetical protein [Domibacillus epiphyticus]|uniref:Uncharacterized protein n=1 Tax=Domibacillus epiphyticus TaxID=1714355 RepID=A0A1V2A849_9BACI|nr:hypothetical protein [Domibacillus epiphyticus]OMP67042.1 hypothetical protein BTO28_08630 [Domibacillus epiphyticus]
MRYEDFMAQISNSIENDWLYDDEIGKFVFRNDIRISIQSDRTESVGDDGFYERWATNFPNENASRKKYFLQFNDCIVDTFYTVQVDGFRSAIPYPRLNGMTITQQQYNIGSIINSIHGYSFDEYLTSAGITVV